MIGPMDTGTEKFLIESLIGELDPKPSLVRDSKTLRVVMVGLSHARHLAKALEGMGASVSLLKITSCRPTKLSMDKAAAELVAAIGGDEE